ncbi:hypothetical protein [Hathewaya massiliensis]|uniref:hypothetical protein n=1 Tax=Hathewaya massiliensis TaxID=1964382 RepID=UPI0011592336|nr:hypothetical protein [Hathewaya massiliensis]
MRKIFKIYKTNYIDICRFKYEFEKFEPSMTLLRENIFNWLDKKNDKEIEDIETMIKVEIVDINGLSIAMSILPLLTFILGIIAALYEKSGITYIFLGALLVILIVLSIAVIKSNNYNKYYTFLQEMIKRYKEERKGKSLS